MKRLIDGARRFQDTVYPKMQSLFDELADGQKPHTLFITCADSRIDPSLITQSDPGEIFVHRNPGNLVPKFGDGVTSEITSIEYAVQVLGVSDIVICGHTKCGVMAGLADPDSLVGLDHVGDWVENARETGHAGGHREADTDPSLMALAGRNVVLQLDNLIGYPFVRGRVATGDLNLYGWVYEIETGTIHVYDRDEKRFVSLAGIEE